MAILQAPRTTSDPAAAAQRRSARRRRTREALPLIGMGVVVTVSVGYGMGTLVQFDHDWREATPVAVAHVVGTAAQGAGLEEAVVDLLEGSSSPVSHVQCATEQHADALLAEQLCRAEGPLGMVSILAAPADGMLHVTVFSGH